jgi:hypothetical protein
MRSYGDGSRQETARMSESPNKSVNMLKCPLCEGRGELQTELLVERLSEKDLGRKVQSYLSDIVEAESKEDMRDVDASTVVKHDVKSWNLTHFFWRRSPKE